MDYQVVVMIQVLTGERMDASPRVKRSFHRRCATSHSPMLKTKHATGCIFSVFCILEKTPF